MELTKGMRVRVDLLKNALEAMKRNRFTTHRVVCNIYMLAPVGNRKSVAIVYNNKQIASYKNGTLTFETYIPSFWGDEKYKYEILCELAEKIGMNVVYKTKEKPTAKQTRKPATKKKTTSKTTKKNNDTKSK